MGYKKFNNQEKERKEEEISKKEEQEKEEENEEKITKIISGVQKIMERQKKRRSEPNQTYVYCIAQYLKIFQRLDGVLLSFERFKLILSCNRIKLSSTVKA